MSDFESRREKRANKKSKGRVAKFNRDSRVIDPREVKRMQEEREKQKRAEKKERAARRKEERARSASAAESSAFKRKKFKIRRRSLTAKERRRLIIGSIILIILIAIIVAAAFGIAKVKLENSNLKQEEAALLREKTQLEEMLKSTSTDKYIREQAREHLNLIEKGEILYKLPQKK